MFYWTIQSLSESTKWIQCPGKIHTKLAFLPQIVSWVFSVNKMCCYSCEGGVQWGRTGPWWRGGFVGEETRRRGRPWWSPGWLCFRVEGQRSPVRSMAGVEEGTEIWTLGNTSHQGSGGGGVSGSGEVKGWIKLGRMGRGGHCCVKGTKQINRLVCLWSTGFFFCIMKH